MLIPGALGLIPKENSKLLPVVFISKGELGAKMHSHCLARSAILSVETAQFHAGHEGSDGDWR